LAGRRLRRRFGVVERVLAVARLETEVQVWASSPPAAPPKEMMTFPPADWNALTCEVNAPSASLPSSHSGVHPEDGVRNARV
jgi:hypothetical protein